MAESTALSVRLVSVDYCQAQPAPGWDACYSEFRGRHATTAPVIRVFGATANGTKACVHVHGVLPYFYIPFDGTGSAATATHQLAAGLDRALSLSAGGGGRQTNALHVHKVVLVAGIPFYGYHKKSHLFFKVFLYNPRMVPKAAELLQSGAVLHRSYQPHEVHIPYLMQFFIDFNLQGMNLMHVSSYKLRTQPGTEGPECSGLEPVSTCQLEADVHAAHILNRMQADAGTGGGNPGLAAIWREERARRRLAGDGRDSQPTPEPQDSRPAPRQPTEIAALAALAARLSEQSQSQVNPSPSDSTSQLDASLPVECNDTSACGPAGSLELPELTPVSGITSTPPPPPPPATDDGDVDEQLVMELSQRADSSIRLDSQDDSLAAALLCLLSPGDEGRPQSEEQRQQDAQDAADELEMSQAVWSQGDQRHGSPAPETTRCSGVSAEPRTSGRDADTVPDSGAQNPGRDSVMDGRVGATPAEDDVASPAAETDQSETGDGAERREKTPSPSPPLSRLPTWRLPQLDGAGDEEPPAEVRRFRRLGTTGRRWTPSSSSGGIGGAFKPVVMAAAPDRTGGPAGDGLTGDEDATGGRDDEDSAREERTKEDSEGLSEGGEPSGVERLMEDDRTMVERTDRVSVISERMDDSGGAGETCAGVITESNKESLVLETIDQSSEAGVQHSAVTGVFVDSAMAEEVDSRVLMTEGRGGTGPCGDGTGGSATTDVIGGNIMAPEKTGAISEVMRQGSAMADEDNADVSMRGEARESSAVAEMINVRSTGSEGGADGKENAMANQNEMSSSGGELIENKRDTAADAKMIEQLPEESSKVRTMVEESPEDTTVADEKNGGDEVLERELTDAAVMVENSGNDPAVADERLKDTSVVENIEETSMVEESPEDITLVNESAKDTTLVEGSKINEAMSEESTNNSVVAEGSGNGNTDTDGGGKGTGATAGPREGRHVARDEAGTSRQHTPVALEANPVAVCSPSDPSSFSPTTESVEVDAVLKGSGDAFHPPAVRYPAAPAASARQRIVSESESSEVSMSSVSDAGSLASVASLLGSPVVVLTARDRSACVVAPHRKTSKKPKRSTFRLSTEKYIRWRRAQRRQRGEISEHNSVTIADMGHQRHEDDGASLAGSVGSDASSRAGSSVSTEPTQYDWQCPPTVDLGIAWLSLPDGQTEMDVWRAVGAVVPVLPRERAAAERAKANGGSVSAALTGAPPKGRPNGNKTHTSETGDSDKVSDTRASFRPSAAGVVKKVSYTEKLLARLDIDLHPVVLLDRLSLQSLSKPQTPTGDLFKIRLSRNAKKLSLSRSLAERGKTHNLRDTLSLSPAARKARSSIMQAKKIMNSPKNAGSSHLQMRKTSISSVKTHTRSVSPAKARGSSRSPVKAHHSPSKVGSLGCSPSSARRVPLSITVSPQKRPSIGIPSQPRKKARVKVTPLRPLSKTSKTSKTPQPPTKSSSTPSNSGGGRHGHPLKSTTSGNVEVLRCPRSNLIWDGHNFVRPPSPKESTEQELAAETAVDNTLDNDPEWVPPAMSVQPTILSQQLTKKLNQTRSPTGRSRELMFAGSRKATARKRTGCDPQSNYFGLVRNSVYVRLGESANHPVMAPVADGCLPSQGQVAQSIGWMGDTNGGDSLLEEVDMKPVLASPTRSPPLQVELTLPPSPQTSGGGGARPVGSTAASRRLFLSPRERPSARNRTFTGPRPSRAPPPVSLSSPVLQPLRTTPPTLPQCQDATLLTRPPPPPPSTSTTLRPLSSLTSLVGSRLLVGSLEVSVGAGQPPVVAVSRLKDKQLQDNEIIPLSRHELNAVHAALQNALRVREITSAGGQLPRPRLAMQPTVNTGSPDPVRGLQQRVLQRQQELQKQQLIEQQEQKRQQLQQKEQQQCQLRQKLQQQRQQIPRPPPLLQRQPPMVVLPLPPNNTAGFRSMPVTDLLGEGARLPASSLTAVLPAAGAPESVVRAPEPVVRAPESVVRAPEFVVRAPGGQLRRLFLPDRSNVRPDVLAPPRQPRVVPAGGKQSRTMPPPGPRPPVPVPVPGPVSVPSRASPVSYMAADSTSSAEETSRPPVPAARLPLPESFGRLASHTDQIESVLKRMSPRKSAGQQALGSGDAATVPGAVATAAADDSSDRISSPESVTDSMTGHEWDPSNVCFIPRSVAASRHVAGGKSKRNQSRSALGRRSTDHSLENTSRKRSPSPESHSRRRTAVGASVGRPSSNRSAKEGPGVGLMPLLLSNSRRDAAEAEDSMQRMGFLSCSSGNNSEGQSPPQPTTPGQRRRSFRPSGESSRVATGDAEGGGGSSGTVLCRQRLLPSPELFEPPDLETPSVDSDADDPPSDTASTSAAASSNAAASTAGSTIRVRAPAAARPSWLARGWSFGENQPRDEPTVRDTGRGQGVRRSPPPRPRARRGGSTSSGVAVRPPSAPATPPIQTFGTEVLIRVGDIVAPPRRRSFVPEGEQTLRLNFVDSRMGSLSFSGSGESHARQRSVGTPSVSWSSLAAVPTVSTGGRGTPGGTGTAVGGVARTSGNSSLHARSTVTVSVSGCSVVTDGSTDNTARRSVSRIGLPYSGIKLPRPRRQRQGRKMTSSSTRPKTPINKQEFQPRIADVTSLAECPAEDVASAAKNVTSAAQEAAASAENAADNEDDEITMVFDSSQRSVEVVELDDSLDEEPEVVDKTPVASGREGGQAAGSGGQSAGPSGQPAKSASQTTGSSGQMTGSSGQTAGSEPGTGGRIDPQSGQTSANSSSALRAVCMGSRRGDHGSVRSVPVTQGASVARALADGETSGSSSGEGSSSPTASLSFLGALTLPPSGTLESTAGERTSPTSAQEATSVLTPAARELSEGFGEKSIAPTTQTVTNALTLAVREIPDDSCRQKATSALTTQNITNALTIDVRDIPEDSCREKATSAPTAQNMTNALTLAVREPSECSADKDNSSPLPASRDWDGAAPESPVPIGGDSDNDSVASPSPTAHVSTLVAGDTKPADEAMDTDPIRPPVPTQSMDAVGHGRTAGHQEENSLLPTDRTPSKDETGDASAEDTASNVERIERPSRGEGSPNVGVSTSSSPVNRDPGVSDCGSPGGEVLEAEDADESALLPLRISFLYDGDASVTADASSRRPSAVGRAGSVAPKSPISSSPAAGPEMKCSDEPHPAGDGGDRPISAASDGDSDLPGSEELEFDLIEVLEEDSTTLIAQSSLPAGAVSPERSPDGREPSLQPASKTAVSTKDAELSAVELRPSTPAGRKASVDSDMFNDSQETFPHERHASEDKDSSQSQPKSRTTEERGGEEETVMTNNDGLSGNGCETSTVVDATSATSSSDRVGPEAQSVMSKTALSGEAEAQPEEAEVAAKSQRPMEVEVEVVEPVDCTSDSASSIAAKVAPGQDDPSEKGASSAATEPLVGQEDPRRMEPPPEDAAAVPAGDASLLVSRAEFGQYLDDVESELTGSQGTTKERTAHHSSSQASPKSDTIAVVSLDEETMTSKASVGVLTVGEETRPPDVTTKLCALEKSSREPTDQTVGCLSEQTRPPAGPDFHEPPLVSAAGSNPPESNYPSGRSALSGGTGGGESAAAPVGQSETDAATPPDQPNYPSPGPHSEPSASLPHWTAGRVCLLLPPPPSAAAVLASLHSEGLPSAPTRPVFGTGRGEGRLLPFEGDFQTSGLYHWRAVAAAAGAGAGAADVTALVSALDDGGGAILLASRRRCSLTPARPPPSRAAVAAWLSRRRRRRRTPPSDSDSSACEDGDSDSEEEEEEQEEQKRSGEERRTTDGPNSASTPLTVSGRTAASLSLSPVHREPALRRTAAYGTVTSVLTPVRPRPTKRRRLVPPLPGPTAAAVQTPARSVRSRLESLVEVEEGGEREGAESGETGSGRRTKSAEMESEETVISATGAESEEVAAVTGGASSQETNFSAPGDGRDSRQGNTPTPLPSGRNLASPLQSAAACRDLASPLAPSMTRRDMTSPLEPSLLISPSFDIQRANSTDDSFGFRMASDNLQDAQCSHEFQYLTCLSLEVHTLTRDDLRPDPEHDPLVAIFYHITNDVPEDWIRPRATSGCIVVDAPSVVAESTGSRRLLFSSADVLAGQTVRYVSDEHALLDALVDLVTGADPDILLGWEVQQLSWGYVLERAERLGRPLAAALSRLPLSERASRATAETDLYGSETTSEIHLAGRVVLNVWRLLRPEVALYSYTFENIAYHVLHQRLPEYSFRQLTEWWQHKSPVNRWRVVEYYSVRSRGTLQILSRLDIIGRTAELARLFGIQFFDVISRGSQFRVESMMLRLAKPRNFVAVSPSVEQRAAARAPECLPLILEPESKMYTDPVVVLDFQSLYPSMIIAYNYCFSTCLGRVEHLGQRGAFPMGCTALQVAPSLLSRLLERDRVHVSPSGAAFVTKECRRGLLPDMLSEILNTRIMVKKAMKANKDNPAVRRLLDFKQLGLKLIANVTYGYTSANFSGRMPCIEVGDSVVSKGRETLERAIRTIQSRPEWDAKVVYGDTDSLFILLKGRSRAEAFKLGEEMAAAVTADNPDPVKLKFEKVYQPCILQTKKRYVGFMYETADQREPVYDAKGIETVRRDGCPAVAKILEKSLRLLFTTHDVSAVRRFVTRQFEKFHRDAVGATDLMFAREFRGRASYQPTACVPALRIADRLARVDPRAEPRVGQRVPYLVVYGAPGLPLIDLVRSPAELRADPSLRPNAEYYVSRVVAPPLQRCLGLLGVDVMAWYAGVPRRLRLPPPQAAAAAATISRFFAGRSCAVCARASARPVCVECTARPLQTRLTLESTARRRERTLAAVREVCAGCCGQPAGVPPACVSIDCPVLWSRTTAERQAEAAPHLRQVLETLV